MSFQIPRLGENCVRRSTPESFEQCVAVVDVAIVIVVALKLDTFFILLNTSPAELTNQLSIHKVNLIKEVIELQQVFNFWNIRHVNTLKL